MIIMFAADKETLKHRALSSIPGGAKVTLFLSPPIINKP